MRAFTTSPSESIDVCAASPSFAFVHSASSVSAEAEDVVDLSRTLRGRSEKPSVLPMLRIGTQMEEAGAIIVRSWPALVGLSPPADVK